MAEEKNTELKWKFKTGGSVSSSPAVLDGVVYFGSEDNHLYAVDTKTGEEKWKFEAGHCVVSSPAVSGGVVYFGSLDYHLYALDAKTGEEKWKFKTGNWIRSSPVVSDNVIYIGSGDNYLYAVDSKTGEEKWKFKAEDYVALCPAVFDDVVYFGSWDNHFYALDAKTGDEKWKFETGDDVRSSPAVFDDVVYFGSGDKHLYALDAKTGEEQWKFETERGVYHPAVSGGVVYFGSDDYHFYALDAKTGEEKWKFEAGHCVESSPAVLDGVVYFGSSDNYLYALDMKTGKEKWAFKTGDWIRSSPVVSDNVIYIGSGDNYLYAVDIEAASALEKEEQKRQEEEKKALAERQKIADKHGLTEEDIRTKYISGEITLEEAIELQTQHLKEEQKEKELELKRKEEEIKLKKQAEKERLKKLEELEAEKRSHWKPDTEENLKKIRELMVSSQFEAGIELALTIDDKYLLLELVDGCKIREDGTVTLNETFAANAAEEDYDILVCALFKMILIINDIQKPGSSLKLENIKVLNLCSFVKLPSNIDSFTNLETVLIAPKHSKSIPKKYSLIKDLQIKTALSAEEIVQALWDNGPADDIYNYSYETEVTHAEADYIENDGLGCERLEEVDPDADDYDPDETEKIKIDVESYIDSNFEGDFFDKVNADTLIEESGSDMVSKDDIESTIYSMLSDLCSLFCGFTVMGGEKVYPELGDNPWEHPNTIYLEVSAPDVSLEDLNPDWTEDEYYLVD